MKKITLLLSLLLISALLLTACGGGNFAASSDAAAAPAAAPEVAATWEAAPEMELFEADDFASWDADETDTDIGSMTTTISAEHIIHTASATIHTETFDDTIERIHALTAQHRGFIEHSHTGGQNWWYPQPGEWIWVRNADFTIRVPAGAYQTMNEALDTLGTVISLSTSATNVSAEHADLTSRLTSLRTQEERMLAILEEATTLSDILELEARLGELIRQIERLTADRNHLNNRVAYSTINLWITEVLDANVSPPNQGLGLGAAFTNSLQTMGAFGSTALRTLIAAIPWILLTLAIAVPIVLIVRRTRRKRKNDISPE